MHPVVTKPQVKFLIHVKIPIQILIFLCIEAFEEKAIAELVHPDSKKTTTKQHLFGTNIKALIYAIEKVSSQTNWNGMLGFSTRYLPTRICFTSSAVHNNSCERTSLALKA